MKYFERKRRDLFNTELKVVRDEVLLLSDEIKDIIYLVRIDPAMQDVAKELGINLPAEEEGWEERLKAVLAAVQVIASEKFHSNPKTHDAHTRDTHLRNAVAEIRTRVEKLIRPQSELVNELSVVEGQKDEAERVRKITKPGLLIKIYKDAVSRDQDAVDAAMATLRDPTKQTSPNQKILEKAQERLKVSQQLLDYARAKAAAREGRSGAAAIQLRAGEFKQQIVADPIGEIGRLEAEITAARNASDSALNKYIADPASILNQSEKERTQVFLEFLEGLLEMAKNHRLSFESDADTIRNEVVASRYLQRLESDLPAARIELTHELNRAQRYVRAASARFNSNRISTPYRESLNRALSNQQLWQNLSKKTNEFEEAQLKAEYLTRIGDDTRDINHQILTTSQATATAFIMGRRTAALGRVTTLQGIPAANRGPMHQTELDRAQEVIDNINEMEQKCLAFHSARTIVSSVTGSRVRQDAVRKEISDIVTAKRAAQAAASNALNQKRAEIGDTSFVKALVRGEAFSVTKFQAFVREKEKELKDALGNTPDDAIVSSLIDECRNKAKAINEEIKTAMKESKARQTDFSRRIAHLYMNGSPSDAPSSSNDTAPAQPAAAAPAAEPSPEEKKSKFWQIFNFALPWLGWVNDIQPLFERIMSPFSKKNKQTNPNASQSGQSQGSFNVMPARDTATNGLQRKQAIDWKRVFRI